MFVVTLPAVGNALLNTLLLFVRISSLTQKIAIRVSQLSFYKSSFYGVLQLLMAFTAAATPK